MADELKKAYEIEAALIPGSGGAFEITVNGELIFSKLQNGRFPHDGEIVKMLNV